MKIRWHFLLLLLATLAALGLGWWLSQPIWSVQGYESVRYAGENKERGELYSLTSGEQQAKWYWETRDSRSGKLLRKLELEVVGRKDGNHFLDVQNAGDPTQAILAFTVHQLTGQTACYLLDGATGKRLPIEPISWWCVDQYVARHQNQLALALNSEVRLFHNKTDPGRSVALTKVKHLSFSPDGSFLACTCDDYKVRLIDFRSGEVIEPTGFDQKLFDVSFLKNGQLLITSMNTPTMSFSQAGLYVSRWQRAGTKLHPVGPSVLLRHDKVLGVPLPVRFKEAADGSLDITMFQGEDWPHGLEKAFTWLEQKWVGMKKWFPKKIYSVCFELNVSNQVVSTYSKWHDGVYELDDVHLLNYLPEWGRANTIMVFRAGRVWPWAVSFRLVVYVGLRLMAKWWKAKKLAF